MALQTVRSRDRTGHAGLISTLLAFATDLATLAEARLALFLKESKTALTQLVVLVACLCGAILFFAFGYIFLIGSVIAGVAVVTHLGWIWVMLMAAGVHFLLVLIALLVARTQMRKRPFPELSAELKKDHQWLGNLDTTSRSTR